MFLVIFKVRKKHLNKDKSSNIVDKQVKYMNPRNIIRIKNLNQSNWHIRLFKNIATHLTTKRLAIKQKINKEV
jgi:hypothetical protein